MPQYQLVNLKVWKQFVEKGLNICQQAIMLIKLDKLFTKQWGNDITKIREYISDSVRRPCKFRFERY